MDVFAIAPDFMRDAAIAAAHELGVFGALPATLDELAAALGVRAARLRALVDVVAALGALRRDGARLVAAVVPPAPVVPRAGWGLAADVIRRDRPLDIGGIDGEARYHRHLAEAGRAAACELAAQLPPGALLDVGGGAGTYTAAYLEAHPNAVATLVDAEHVVALARERLAGFGDRVRLIVGDAETAPVGARHDVVLVSNVLHLHGPEACDRLVAAAVRAAAPGGVVVIKDLRIEDDRSGPLEGVLFALNMALYTADGDVYPTSQLRRWLEAAGAAAIEERRLAAAPDAVVLVARRP